MLPGAPACAFQSLCLGAGFSECQPWLVFGAGAEPGEPLLDLSTHWGCAPSVLPQLLFWISTAALCCLGGGKVGLRNSLENHRSRDVSKPASRKSPQSFARAAVPIPCARG